MEGFGVGSDGSLAAALVSCRCRDGARASSNAALSRIGMVMNVLLSAEAFQGWERTHVGAVHRDYSIPMRMILLCVPVNEAAFSLSVSAFPWGVVCLRWAVCIAFLM